MQRVERIELTQLKRPLSAYLRHNLHYTFAGFHILARFLGLLLIDRGQPHDVLGRLSLRLDSRETRILEQIPVSAADRALIAHSNAEKLFRLWAVVLLTERHKSHRDTVIGIDIGKNSSA